MTPRVISVVAVVDVVLPQPQSWPSYSEYHIHSHRISLQNVVHIISSVASSLFPFEPVLNHDSTPVIILGDKQQLEIAALCMVQFFRRYWKVQGALRWIGHSAYGGTVFASSMRLNIHPLLGVDRAQLLPNNTKKTDYCSALHQAFAYRRGFGDGVVSKTCARR